MAAFIDGGPIDYIIIIGLAGYVFYHYRLKGLAILFAVELILVYINASLIPEATEVGAVMPSGDDLSALIFQRFVSGFIEATACFAAGVALVFVWRRFRPDTATPETPED